MKLAEKILKLSEARIGTLKPGDVEEVLDELDSLVEKELTKKPNALKSAMGAIEELRDLLT